MKANPSAVTCLLTALLSHAATAGDSEDLFNLSLEELSQIKVTVAGRNSQLVREAASLVTVFTDADLRRLGVRNLGELLGYVPGMRSYRNAGTSPWLDSYESRGVRDDFSAMLLLLIDGHRINSPYNGGTAQMFQHSLANAARVEIIRGPGSALYGSSALLGVINIITRSDANDAFIGIGPDGAREASVSGAFNTDDWRGSLHVNRQQSDGQRYDDIFDVNNRITSIRDPFVSDEWNGLLAYQKNELYIRGSKQQLDAFYQVNFVHPDNRTEQDGTEVGLRSAWQNDAQSLSVTGQLSRMTLNQTSYANRAIGGSAPFVEADWLGGFLVEMESDTVTLDALWRQSELHTVAAGLRQSEEKVEEASLYSNYRLTDFAYLGSIQAVSELLPPATRSVTGLYVQDQLQWNRHWQSTLGLRHDKYEDIGSATSPRVALQFYDGEHNTLKLMHGRAYRAPASNELYTSDNPVTLGNPELDPVRSQTTELMWLHEASGWRLEASLFEQKIRDQILSEFIGPGLRQFTNKGELRVRGAELDWLLPLSPQWRSRVQASWIADIDEQLGDSTGQDSGEHNTPHRWGSAELNYVADSWSWHLAARYTGPVALLPDQGSYWLWRTHAIWSLAGQHELSLTINNLFDEDYRNLTSIAGFGLNDDGEIERSLPGRGREVWLRYGWRW